MIRLATIDDLSQLTAIYNQAIESKKATADLLPFIPDQRRPWFLFHVNNKRTPIYVFVDSGTVAGYCYLSEYRSGRQALEKVAEISYYIDSNFHRHGIGSKLVNYTIGEAKKLGYKNLLAILFSCNDGSIHLLEKFGFQHWGTLPNILHIDDNIYSHYYYGLCIDDSYKES